MCKWQPFLGQSLPPASLHAQIAGKISTLYKLAALKGRSDDVSGHQLFSTQQAASCKHTAAVRMANSLRLAVTMQRGGPESRQESMSKAAAQQPASLKAAALLHMQGPRLRLIALQCKLQQPKVVCWHIQLPKHPRQQGQSMQ